MKKVLLIIGICMLSMSILLVGCEGESTIYDKEYSRGGTHCEVCNMTDGIINCDECADINCSNTSQIL